MLDPKSTADLVAGARELLLAPHTPAAFDAWGPTTVNYALCAFWVVLSLAVGVATDNLSQVDKLWSLTPWMYVWVYAWHDLKNVRLAVMALVATVWGIRLTLNFNRRGGYTWPPWEGEEDYRWEYVRKMFSKKESPIKWHLFHLGFVCFFQHAVLLWIALPAQVVYANRDNAHPFGYADVALTALILGLLAFEAVADEEQYEFQTRKHALLRRFNGDKRKLPAPYSHGFVHGGVWALSRHPNYFAEQAVWVCFNGYALLALRAWVPQVANVGCVLLIGIFSQSLPLAESITLKKWPLYWEYQKRVPALFPYGTGLRLERQD